VHHVYGYIPSIALWVGVFYHYSLIALVQIGMFYNQHHPNYSGNKLWAGMFQTSLINLLYYSYLLSISFVMNVADIYHPHVVILALWGFDHLSLSYLVKLIHVRSIHALVILIPLYFNGFSRQHQVSLMWLFPTTFDEWFASLPLRVFRPESRDEILFRGEGCDSSCTCNARHIFC
jgi:hypothetical protein